MQGLRADFHRQAVRCPDLFGGLPAARASPGDSSGLRVERTCYFKKYAQFLEKVANFSWPRRRCQVFPVPRLSRVAGTEFAPPEFSDDALPVALEGIGAAEAAVEVRFHADRENDTRRLHAHREASRVELRDRLPRHDLVKVIKRHTEQAFELLTRPERMPLGMRETGSRVAEVLECDDDPAVLVPDAAIALSFEPRAWHLATLCGGQRTKRKEFYAGSGRGCGSRAPVNRGGGAGVLPLCLLLWLGHEHTYRRAVSLGGARSFHQPTG